MTHTTTGGIIAPPSHLLPLLDAEFISGDDAELLEASGLYAHEPMWIGGRGYVGYLLPQRMDPDAPWFRRLNGETWQRLQ